MVGGSKLKVSLILIVLLSFCLVACNADIASRGGGNATTNSNNTSIDISSDSHNITDHNGDGLIDNSDVAASCEDCIADPETCNCFTALGCTESDLSDEGKAELAACLGTDLSSGAL